MVEIRTHGRGGQGAVTAMEVLAKAAGMDGKYSQAFPHFGVERRGAPIKAFTRIDDRYITIRSQIYNPDYILVMDPSLMDLPEITEGLKEGSVAVINGKGGEGNLKQKAYYYDATSAALSVLGKDIVNTAILGVFAKVTGLVTIDSILKAIDDNFPEKLAEKNKNLVRKAYEETKA